MRAMVPAAHGGIIERPDWNVPADNQQFAAESDDVVLF
jgi:hypothetical protein